MTKAGLLLGVAVLMLAGCAGPDEERALGGDDGERPGQRLGFTRESAGGPAEQDDLEKYWNGLTESIVLDSSFNYHDSTDPFANVFHRVSQPTSNPCTWDDEDGVYFNNRAVPIEDGKTVWPGTGKVVFGLTWGDDVVSTVDALAVAFRSGSQGPVRVTPYISNGQTAEVLVTPEDWDIGPNSAWRLHVCVTDGENGSEDLGKYFDGDFHITMTIVRGTP